MDQNNFDDLTRSMAGETGTRRWALRTLGGALLGGVLAGSVASLGLTEVAAKEKKHHGKPKHKGKSHAERKAHQSRGVQTEGKRNGKRQHNHKPRRAPSPPPPPPPAPLSCAYPCPDGTCPASAQCCPGEKLCVEPESPSGFSCIDPNGCCPDQKMCGDGCIYRQACCEAERPQCGPCDEVTCVNGSWVCSTTCCPGEKHCPGSACVGTNACCPGEKRCADNSCVPSLDCCPNERQCVEGVCVGQNACCLGEKQCPDGDCIPENACCPNEAPPVCGECEVAVCQGGSWGCQAQSGCCPAGGVVCPPVPAQPWPWPVPGIDLPEGCCRAEKMFTDPITGRPACAQPWSGGGAWFCD